MPELPEVETTRRGIAPTIEGRLIEALVVREPRLRWPVPESLARRIEGERVGGVRRRGKYLLLELEKGAVLVHLGMSGSLRLSPRDAPPGKHDHVDLVMEGGFILRLTDPRRFGAVLWAPNPPDTHWLLRDLGPEPLETDFNGDYLFAKTRRRRASVKDLIMNAKVVVGVGNIYANEALFRAGIRPGIAAHRLTRARCVRLVDAIRATLTEAIRAGGTTLRDFVGGDGRPGYFARELLVYGRVGEPCRACGGELKAGRAGQRATVYCSHCQH
ncbi:MAG: bifunctional DNA-formamidopyrimidine glycosylase/DNA-(apurinic or apyrimidinic site) lyase [Gammaproteobacteria bacterium]|jgi:formamidopyrimidine-DNA glycosylase